jgi:hypothetical protein
MIRPPIATAAGALITTVPQPPSPPARPQASVLTCR